MTFLTDVMKKGYSEEEILAVLGESEQDRKSRRVLAKVTETVEAHPLQQMKDLLTLEKLATWRRINGFDGVADGEDNWFHGPRSLPPTPEEFAADLWCAVNILKDAISMPARTRPWQKTIELVDGLKGKLPDEELAVIKRYVEKRSRETVLVTVTLVNTVQYCSPSPQTPEPSPDVCVNLENNEGRMDPERGELKPPSAGTGLETPGQQCPPNEGTWEKRRTITDGYLFVGIGSNQGGDIFSPTTERVDTRAVRTTTTTSAASNITFLQQGHKPKDKNKDSEENKQLDPGGKGEKASLWNAAVISIFLFFWRELWAMGGPLLVLRVFVCVCPSALFFNYCSFQVTTFQRAEKHEERRGSSR